MRRIMYSVAMSLDGYIAGPNGEYDWIPEDDTIDWNAFMSRFDTVLMGRPTYEIALQQGSGGAMPNMRTYVFSRTLSRDQVASDITLVTDDAVKTVSQLKAESGKDIWLMGGGVLFRGLLDAGLVDSVEVGIVPILLGEGIPFLPPGPGKTHLTLANSKTYPSGITHLTFDV